MAAKWKNLPTRKTIFIGKELIKMTTKEELIGIVEIDKERLEFILNHYIGDKISPFIFQDLVKALYRAKGIIKARG